MEDLGYLEFQSKYKKLLMSAYAKSNKKCKRLFKEREVAHDREDKN